jgi:dihydrolipoamide dehydrogenase
MSKSDIIIIGAGPGGYRAAELAAKQGLSVTVFEKERVGGTCLNVGCIPTKCLARNAELLLSLSDAAAFGVENLSYAFNFQTTIQRKDQVVDSLRQGVETILSHPSVSVVRAHAAFKDEHTVIADGNEYEADHIIIATGSSSKTLPIDIAEGCEVLDSSDLLSLGQLPKSICIIGAGVIGMEFASIFNAFGVEVTVVEFLKECLPVLDSDIAKRLRKMLEKRGITFHLQCAVSGISKDGVAFVNKKGKTECVQAEKVLMAVGRKPNTEGLGLDAIDVSLERGAVPVDASSFRVVGSAGSPLGSVYAIGDANGLQMLAHAAEMQAAHVVNQLLGKADDIRLDIMPAAIFTTPEAACVGLSEDECKNRGIDYACRKSFWRANGKAMAMGESDGMLKLLTGSDGLILGCHAFGAHAADIIQEVSSLMCRRTTVCQLADMVHIHPTLSEILKTAAEG